MEPKHVTASIESGEPAADADICPAFDAENLERLAVALIEIGSRIRSADAPGGLAFTCDATFLRSVELVNVVTQFGELDISFRPSRTSKVHTGHMVG